MATDAAEMSASLYDRGFYAWANEQAALLRTGGLAAADIENIAEEIESLARRERRELTELLAVLLTHLLIWRASPERRGRNLLLTILLQRRRTARLMGDSGSLRSELGEILPDAYESALLVAQRETDLPEAAFPAESPWSYDQAMDGEPRSDEDD
jgi:hypothetical protein